jgi:LCP family protein required for cell wall assembly
MLLGRYIIRAIWFVTTSLAGTLGRMTKRQWGVLQWIAISTFFALWAIGLVALGLTLSNGVGGGSPTAVALDPSAITTAQPSPTPTLTMPPTPTPAPTDTPSPTPTPTTTPTPTPTATPTPTPTPLPPNSMLPVVPVWPTVDPARPTPENPLPIPTPVSPVAVALDAVNVAVLGSDQRPDWTEWHTDAIHIVSIQRERGVVSVVSIPRDLYVYIPGFWMSRINFADFYGEAYGYPGGGPALVRDTILYNLGIRVDYCVRTNFDGLIGIVDILGGVDIPVHCRLTDHWPYPDENGEYPILTLEPGIHHLDGETALWYARSRYTTSVFSRERRQQQVLQAIWHRARDAGMLSQIPELWQQVQGMVVTDLDFGGILDLAPTAFLLQDQNVRFYNIGRGSVTPWTTPRGGSVFLPQWEAVEPIVAEAMAPVPEARLARTYMPAEVWNGTPNQDWDLLAADRLYRAGFPAIIGQPDRRDYAATQIIVFSEYAKGTGVAYLQQMFNVPDSRVIYQTSDLATIGFRVILGADYQTCYQR